MDAVERYLLLGLRLGRHVDGLVDFYYGPAELAEQVREEPLVAPPELAAEAGSLLESLDLDSSWLRAQARGLETYARVLAGEEIPYSDEVEACYGVRPQYVPEEQFTTVHLELDRLLPGKGSLPDRYETWRSTQFVPSDRLGEAFERCVAMLRSRTAADFGLPEGESCSFDYVQDEPWLAFNDYQGGLQSRIAVNVDLPITAHELLGLAAHEAYPGHHTEHAWKEAHLVRERGHLEESIALVPTPQPLVSEGIAALGRELFVVGDTLRELATVLVDVGVSYDPGRARAVAEAREPLAAVPGNAALMIHESGISESSAVAYAMRWGLTTEAQAQRWVAFVTNPTWRAYIVTYAEGLRLCRGFVGSDRSRFRRLLTEQVTVEELLAVGEAAA